MPDRMQERHFLGDVTRSRRVVVSSVRGCSHVLSPMVFCSERRADAPKSPVISRGFVAGTVLRRIISKTIFPRAACDETKRLK